MNSASPLQKKALRERLRAHLLKLPVARRQADSARACTLLAQQPVWQQARAILFYAPLADEVDLRPLLEQVLAEGKTVALPRFVTKSGRYEACHLENSLKDCVAGQFGIGEPPAHAPSFPLNRLDFALVPGLGFSPTGHRLGRGRGYYDRILAEVTAVKCGVAFDEQIVQDIPVEPHDMVLDFILTPTQWVEVPGAGPLLPP